MSDICDVIKETDISLVHQPTEHFNDMQQKEGVTFQFLGVHWRSREERLFEAMDDKIKTLKMFLTI